MLRSLLLITLFFISPTHADQDNMVSEPVLNERGYWLEREYGEYAKLERCQDLLTDIDQLLIDYSDDDDQKERQFLKFQIRRFQIEANELCRKDLIKNTVWQGELFKG